LADAAQQETADEAKTPRAEHDGADAPLPSLRQDRLRWWGVHHGDLRLWPASVQRAAGALGLAAQ
jgi:hypothetical protein